jgi:hypothetical protein
MRIDHRGPHVAVAKKLLHRPYVIPIFQQVRREAVAQGMAAAVLVDPCGGNGLLYSALHGRLAEVVASGLARAGVRRGITGGEHVLPGPLPRSIGIFVLQGIGEIDLAESGGKVLLMPSVCVQELTAQRLHQARREQGDSILRTLAVAYYDLAALEFDVLDA